MVFMEIKEIIEIEKKVEELSFSLTESSYSNNNQDDFIKEYEVLLKEKGINTQTANIAIRCVDIDTRHTIVSVFNSLEQKKAKDALNVIRGCEEFKKNYDYKALKLMCIFAATSLRGGINTKNLFGKIVLALVSCFRYDNENDSNGDIYSILYEYFLKDISTGAVFPDWNTTVVSPDCILSFCGAINTVFAKYDNETQISAGHKMKKWINDGENVGLYKKELKEREKEKPEKKSEDLFKLAEFYKSQEGLLDRLYSELATFSVEKKRLMDKVFELEEKDKISQNKIENLNAEIKRLNSTIKDNNKEIEQKKNINDEQVQYSEDSMNSLLGDLARSLKFEYDDYAETINVPMNEMLGEIYRDKVGKIFNILKQNGIDMED